MALFLEELVQALKMYVNVQIMLLSQGKVYHVLLQQHLMYVQQMKKQQQVTHVIVQTGEHLVDQVELGIANVQMVKHIQQRQDVVLHHQIIAHQE